MRDEYEIKVLSDEEISAPIEKTMRVETKISSGDRSWLRSIFFETLVPLLLIVLTPNFTVCLIYYVTKLNSQSELVLKNGLFDFWSSAWHATCPSNAHPWLLVICLVVWAAISVLLPVGKPYNGPVTTDGFQPTYRSNGFVYYVATCSLWLVLLGTGTVPALEWYRRLPELAGVLNVMGLAVCLLLLVKGHFRPSPGEHGSSGNALFDFYWGMELYPRIGEWLDVKMLTNCRFGMMLWQLIILLSWFANHDLLHSDTFSWPMTANVLLQSVYIAKFYWWEDGYMNSIDIILDRAGYYICWGCIFFVPTFYTLSSVSMVGHTNQHYGPIHFSINVVFGLAMIGCNYWADRQRQVCSNANGDCNIWLRPAKVVRAKYTHPIRGECDRVLLASGFWGLSRHCNYVFEILGALAWSLAALFPSPLPYLYVIFLTVLLVHRSHRDELKCRRKYGHYWQQYSEIAKYKLIPFLY